MVSGEVLGFASSAPTYDPTYRVAPVTPQQSERYFHNTQIQRRSAGLVQQTVQIVARFAITI